MSFFPPTEEQRFVLEHVVQIFSQANSSAFETVDDELLDAVLIGAAELAANEWAPTNRVGDTSPPIFADGVVTMPQALRDAHASFVSGGWSGISVAEELGGQGLPTVIGLAVMESLGAANMALGLCPILSGGAVEAIAHHGSAFLKSTFLPQLVSGAWTGTMNLTEPQAGSDVGALRTQATPLDDERWLIKGVKIFITFGEHDLAENIVHLVLARTPDAPVGTRGISLFLVPKILPDGNPNDVRCVSIEHKQGIHGSPTCVMSFGDNDNCIGWLVGEQHAGMQAMFTMMNNARLNVGLQGVQIAERATQQAVSYAQERVQSPLAGESASGPVPIIRHPDVRRMLMRMKAQTQAIRTLVYATGAEIDKARAGDMKAIARLDLLTPLAKSHATDVGCEVASIGIQVHGGMGFIEETGAAQYYRDARIAPIYEGTNGIQAADLVGRKLIGDDGRAVFQLIGEILAETTDENLIELAKSVECATSRLLQATVTDRLAASSPYLTMISTLVCGWLMERQMHIARDLSTEADGLVPFLKLKIAAGGWYLGHIVPEASALAASIEMGSRFACDLSDDDFAS